MTSTPYSLYTWTCSSQIFIPTVPVILKLLLLRSQMSLPSTNPMIHYHSLSYWISEECDTAATLSLKPTFVHVPLVCLPSHKPLLAISFSRPAPSRWFLWVVLSQGLVLKPILYLHSFSFNNLEGVWGQATPKCAALAHLIILILILFWAEGPWKIAGAERAFGMPPLSHHLFFLPESRKWKTKPSLAQTEAPITAEMEVVLKEICANRPC